MSSHLFLARFLVLGLVPLHGVAQVASPELQNNDTRTVFTRQGMSVEIAERKHSALCSLQKLLVSSSPDQIVDGLRQHLNLDAKVALQTVKAAEQENNCKSDQ